jgi:hypothetical protein
MKTLFIVAAIGVALSGCQKQQAQATSGQEKSGAKTSTQATPTQVALPTKPHDGPFGLAGSLPVAELERMGFKLGGGSPSLYFGKPPKPLQDADSYAVVATPTAGVCRIMAHIEVPVVNGSGDQLKEKADRLADAMQVKYGKYSEKVNYIKQDVYRRNPEYWMLGLKEESVLYAYDWSSGKTEKPLPGDLDNIEIAADTTRLDSGYVSIKYTFKNFGECRKEMEARKADSL